MLQGLQALGQKTAVNGEIVAGDVGGRGKTEKRDRCRDFFGFCHAPEWGSLQDLAQSFLLFGLPQKKWTRRAQLIVG